MKYAVYKYTFPDGMVYIGMTHVSIQQRRDCGYQHNKRLTNAIKEAGWKNVGKEILSECDSREEAFAEEKRQIMEHNSTNPSIGYNVSYGGKSTFEGLKHTPESRRKMSELYKGRTFSAETIERMREAHKDERHPVECFTEKWESVGQYLSLRDAAKAVKGYGSNVKRACDSGKTYKGYRWQLVERKEVV